MYPETKRRMQATKCSNYVEKSNTLVISDDSPELELWTNIKQCGKPSIHVLTLPLEKNDRINTICSNPTQNVVIVGTDWGNIILLHLDTLKSDSDSNSNDLTCEIVILIGELSSAIKKINLSPEGTLLVVNQDQ